METGLDCLRPNGEALVVSIRTDEALKKRLRAFGLVPGTKVRCGYRCPWGTLTAIRLRGSVVALRTEDLRKIRVRC